MMLVVAENINVMSKKLGKAMKNRDPKPIQETAIKLTEAGADYLDLNIGPAKKMVQSGLHGSLMLFVKSFKLHFMLIRRIWMLWKRESSILRTNTMRKPNQ